MINILIPVLSFVALILQLFAFLGDVRNIAFFRDIYYFRLDIIADTGLIPSGLIPNGLIPSDIQHALGDPDFVTFGLFGFCQGLYAKGVTFCSPPTLGYKFGEHSGEFRLLTRLSPDWSNKYVPLQNRSTGSSLHDTQLHPNRSRPCPCRRLHPLHLPHLPCLRDRTRDAAAQGASRLCACRSVHRRPRLRYRHVHHHAGHVPGRKGRGQRHHHRQGVRDNGTGNLDDARGRPRTDGGHCDVLCSVVSASIGEGAKNGEREVVL
ncbi:hypothetical protein BC938DRAFT_471626 [Jimgerdemannia flammicorona]|uniref:Uncharacterized protein n=1 Tax=Jimgerdemannia flammicorona TaxID=994334 RepID=A0A433QUI3_9FUNG|nr:hypothetical protein BC938DRAFT_471626 [Jimgerdemannia flammicorona]